MRDAVQTGRLADRELDESSGMVESVAEPGVFWSQNDSGNDEYLFAYDSTGRARGRVLVRGGKNRDWEALTTGPCAEGQCLVIGDVGDNSARRDDLTLYQIAEPLQTAVSVPVLRTLSLRYADAPHDVEAMYAGPDGTLWLVTKRPQRGSGGERTRGPEVWRGGGGCSPQPAGSRRRCSAFSSSPACAATQASAPPAAPPVSRAASASLSSAAAAAAAVEAAETGC